MLGFLKRNKSFRTENASPSDVAMMSRFLVSTKERDYIERALGIPIHKFTDYQSYLDAGCKRVWVTFRCMRLIESRVISARFKVVDPNKNGSRVSGAGNFSEGGFLTEPNPYDTWTDVMALTCWHLGLTGNAYWLKDEVDLVGRPTALYPLLPQHIEPVPDRKQKISSYIYRVNGQEIIFDAKEIIHFKRTHPNDLCMGLGDVEGSEAVFNDFINKDTLNEKFLSQGAQPSGILHRKDSIEDQDQWEALKSKWEADYGGKENAGKTAFLNGDWNYIKLGMTMAEMQALEKERWTTEQIILNHGVPLSVFGLKNAQNYATSRQEEVNFRRYTIVPLIDVIVTKLNNDGFISAKNANLMLSYDFDGLVDMEQISKDFGPLVDRGIMTRNEVRERAHLELVDDPLMDIFTVNFQVIPLEMSGLASPTDNEISESLEDKSYHDEDDDEEEDEEQEKDVSAAVRKGLQKKVKDHNEKVGNAKTKRTNLRTLIAVFKRGVGAYNTNPGSVRPNVTSPDQWAYARVNSFLYVLRNGRFRSGKHDTDLLPKGHPLSSKGYHDGENPPGLVENLYTEGGELVLTRTGEEYVGYYHIHPDGGPMVGATHSDQPHAYLTYIRQEEQEDSYYDDEEEDKYSYDDEEEEDKSSYNDDEEEEKAVKRRKPPKGAIASYRDGIRRHENGETGGGLEPITVRMAKDFISGGMPTDEWTSKANRWWGRNKRFLDEPKGSPAYAAAQLWGGRAGMTYWPSEARRRELI